MSVIFNNNLSEVLNELIKPYSKVLFISDPRVHELHFNDLKKQLKKDVHCHILNSENIEKNKNLQTIEQILNSAFEANLDRKSLFVGFGGGATTDIAGFASGIFMRGIDCINIPTTLLGMVDASIGGKTGVNSKYGKNLIGLFKEPKAILIKTTFLQTLDLQNFRSGMAEVLKIALAFDCNFYEELKKYDLKILFNESNILEQIIKKAIDLKRKITELDFKESGIRAGLNYGHTFAHVIENEANYEGISHGEAVAIGMQMANLLSLKQNMLSQNELLEIQNLLALYDLDLTYKIKDKERFYQKFFSDKKTKNGILNFVLLSKIGEMNIVNAPKNTVLEVLDYYSK
ncbi:MAG: 3-dehydroquinate synthase [Helicobacter sp.]|nr:3-dehydroquinate synthase [Helicobacter sp.]